MASSTSLSGPEEFRRWYRFLSEKKTPLLEGIVVAKNIPTEKFEERLQSIKMNRIGTPEEVAKVIYFFASDLSSYVTGQVLGVDGGMVI